MLKAVHVLVPHIEAALRDACSAERAVNSQLGDGRIADRLVTHWVDLIGRRSASRPFDL